MHDRNALGMHFTAVSIRIAMNEALPSYIESRIRQHLPAGIPIVPRSTPVISFGDARKSTVVTLGWNPSKLEFLDGRGHELVGKDRRLETLTSIRETDLLLASERSISRIVYACNSYFQRNPYRWFNSLEKVLKHLRVSYYDGTACHLDLVQWATDPVWGRLSQAHQSALLSADIPFLDQQLSQGKIKALLLNGKGIVSAYQDLLQGRLVESPIQEHPRLRLFSGRDVRGFMVVGWNINLQSSFGVSNYEIEAIGLAVQNALAVEFTGQGKAGKPTPPIENPLPLKKKKWWRFWGR
jgi:hypothetical protein